MRKTFVATLAAVALVCGAARADPGLQRVPLGYQQITSLSSAKGLTVPAGATLAVIAAEGEAIRYRDDGTAPTASVGMPLAVGVALQYQGTLTAIQFIEQTSGATLDVLYYR